MFAAIGQYVGGKVITAILVVASAGVVIFFWKNPEKLETIWHIVKYGIVWIAFVLVLPWATFFVTPWVVSKESNAAAALMLLGYLLADVIVALLLIGGMPERTLAWFVLVLGFLSAGVYNFKDCEYHADRLEEI